MSAPGAPTESPPAWSSDLWRLLLAASAATVLSLYLPGLLSIGVRTFWRGTLGMAAGWILVGCIGGLIAQRRAAFAVAVGLGALWVPVIVTTRGQGTARWGAMILFGIVLAVIAAEAAARARRAGAASN